MPDQIESALVIQLREAIPWESSLDVPTAGTLTQINPGAPFDARQYQQRDRQLSYRDMINAAAVVRVSVEVSNIWNYPATKPLLQSQVGFQQAHQPAEAGNLDSTVRHVKNVSIPFDACRFADKDLYGRDALIFEVLARACQTAFTVSPLARIDMAGTIPNTSIWSLAEGQPVRADINPALPLNRDLFKLPDQNLADRDNQIAGYAARIIQVLKNPFEHADRLYVSVTGMDTREPEVYGFTRQYWQPGAYTAGTEVFYQIGWFRALVNTANSPTTADWTSISAPTRRVFTCEPALSSRNQIIYDTQAKTLQWFRENLNTVHIPQIYAMSIPGIVLGQVISTLPQIPEPKDAQYWRSKAAQIVPTGEQLTDRLNLAFTASNAVTGGVMQVAAASMTVPDTLVVTLDGSLTANKQRVSVLALPSSTVQITGAQNVKGTSGTLGGATYQVNVQSGGIVPAVDYLVQGGGGVVYAGGTYAPGATFTGLSGTNTFNALGGSTLRQYSTTFSLPLPVGAWQLQIDYTNLQGTTTGFGVRADYLSTGNPAETVLQDTAALPFIDANGNPLPNGQIVSSTPIGFDVVSADRFSLPIFWTYGDGQFHIRKLTFSAPIQSGHYVMTGTLGGATANVDVRGQAGMPDVLVFDMQAGSVSPAVFTMAWSEEALLPIQVKQVQIQSVGTYTPTVDTDQLPAWRWEMVERAGHAAQQAYATALRAYGANTPVFRSSGSSWDALSTETWMSFIEVYQPRVREQNNIPQNGIVDGRQYKIKSGPVVYNSGTYSVDQKFYGTLGITNYAGGLVDQVGAFVKSKVGHVGKPALVPLGLEFVAASGTVAAHYDSPFSIPQLVALQPWMVDVGLYVAQFDFWMPYNL